MTAPVLILGYGNPLRGDDGIGWHAAEKLRSRSSGALAVMQLHQLTPELAAEVRAAKAVLFVDAARDGTPGELGCREVTAEGGGARFTHQFTPATLLQLTAELFGSAPVGYEITLVGESFELSDQLSPRIAAEMPRLIECVAGIAREVAVVAEPTAGY